MFLLTEKPPSLFTALPKVRLEPFPRASLSLWVALPTPAIPCLFRLILRLAPLVKPVGRLLKPKLLFHQPPPPLRLPPQHLRPPFKLLHLMAEKIGIPVAQIAE